MSIDKPQFETVSGDFKDNITIVSSDRTQILTGQTSTETTDLQIEVNGGGFESNPDLVRFEDGEFNIPNQDVFPEGLKLNRGENTIRLRAVGPTGRVSNPAEATVRVVKAESLDVTSSIPTGMSVRRHEGSVEIVWTQTQEVDGYNIYASTESGGGSSGYRRLNKDLIVTPNDRKEEKESFDSLSATYDTSTADFSDIRVRVTKEDSQGQTVETIADKELGTNLFRQPSDQEVSVQLQSIDEIVEFSFDHDRSDTQEDGVINNEFFSDVPPEDPLFYVVTAVNRDPETNQKIESPFSPEVVGNPLTIDTQLNEPPRRERFDVRKDFIDKVQSFDDQISMIPGSVGRDVFVDPFSSEAERLYFMADFIRKSQSFPTLLQIDETPSYKESLQSALGLGPGAGVQDIIDDSFDRLATNVNVERKQSREAVGEVTFYTEKEPQKDLVVEEGTTLTTEGSDSVEFRTTGRVVLEEDQKESFFNEQRGRWEINVDIEATEPGSEGNVSAGQITNAIGPTGGMKVVNLESTRFGQDEESNQSLAERAMMAFTSVDAGTEQGYLSTALEQRDVVEANVVKAGDELMMRDWDPAREKHIGGKVDVWIQGQDRKTKTESFALTLSTARSGRFVLDSKPSKLVFRARDPNLSEETPIVEILGDDPKEKQQGFEFKNLTTGDVFDLSGHKIIDYNRIQLDTSKNQPSIGPNDVIVGDYKFLASNEYVPQTQPVVDAQNIESQETGEILEKGVHFDLHRTDDPLLRGRSSQASNFVRIVQKNGIPTGDLFQVNDEKHVLVSEEPEPLKKLGATEISIRVFTSDRKKEYKGPSNADPDFFIEEGSETEPLEIRRNPNGEIGDGEEVSVDYEHQENFDITYTFNRLTDTVQSAIDEHRHITADVLVKQSLEHGLKLDLTIVLTRGASKSQVDARVRTQLSQLLNTNKNGTDVHQSDIVKALESVDGVGHVIMPVSTFTHDDGNLRVREPLDEEAVFIKTTSSADLYLLKEELNFKTEDGGGTEKRHRGVFRDTQPLDLRDTLSEVESGPNRAMIIGQEGMILNGYSDDQTLDNAGFSTAQAKEEERINRTANRALVSLSLGETTANHHWSVSYITHQNTDTRSTIAMDAISHSELGNFELIYDTPE